MDTRQPHYPATPVITQWLMNKGHDGREGGYAWAQKTNYPNIAKYSKPQRNIKPCVKPIQSHSSLVEFSHVVSLGRAYA